METNGGQPALKYARPDRKKEQNNFTIMLCLITGWCAVLGPAGGGGNDSEFRVNLCSRCFYTSDVTWADYD